jgi:hypothetical protein
MGKLKRDEKKVTSFRASSVDPLFRGRSDGLTLMSVEGTVPTF